MACGSCGGGNRNRGNTSPVPAAAPGASVLYEVMRSSGGQPYYRSRDLAEAKRRTRDLRQSDPGAYYRRNGSTAALPLD